MTKFGQAEYSDFMAKVFADKLDEILETAENRISITRILKIYTVSSRLQGMQRRRDWDVSRIFNWLACRRYRWSNHNVSLHSSRTSG